LFLDLYEIIGNVAKPDFYISMNFETLDFIMCQNKKIKFMLLENDFENKDLEFLHRIRIIKCVLSLMPHRILKIFHNYNLFNTNISRISFMVSLLRFKILHPLFVFCDLPVKHTNARIELDKENTETFLNEVYYNTDLKINTNNFLIDIRNASKKPRMAEKAAWLLRSNKFDVLDWNSSPIVYDTTLIRDYKGNFRQALKIAELLNVGEVIVSYDDKIYSDMTVFVGKDCVIYDVFDKNDNFNAKK
jgi:hypothetical protein